MTYKEKTMPKDAYNLMIPPFRPWWRFWWTKEEKKQIRYEDGYNWAAGRLLRGASFASLEALVDCAIHFADFDHFDAGVQEAIQDYKTKLV
jgi:hypothetical protein